MTLHTTPGAHAATSLGPMRQLARKRLPLRVRKAFVRTMDRLRPRRGTHHRPAGPVRNGEAARDA